jgi:hypothetical protein
MSTPFNRPEAIILIPFAPFSRAFSIACLMTRRYGIRFSICRAIENATIPASMSGFFTSFTSTLNGRPIFWLTAASICEAS